MLNNLKRTYVELRSFPQARCATDLLLSADPTLLSELRDRGLLAYHLDDYGPRSAISRTTCACTSGRTKRTRTSASRSGSTSRT